MQKSKALTTLHNYQNDLKLPNRNIGGQDLRVEESKIPKLQEVIDQWKLQVQTNKTNLDQSVMLSVNSVDEKDVFIQHLKNKIDTLQSHLQSLCQKHVEICQQLFKEIQKRAYFEQMLKKQNLQLNRQMKDMMTDFHTVVNHLNIKSNFLFPNESKNSENIKTKKFKENVSPARRGSSKDLIFKSDKDKKSRKIPRLLSDKSKFKVFSSFNKGENSCEKYCENQLHDKKTNEYNDLYYSKQKKTGGKQLTPSKIMRVDKSRIIIERRKSKTYIEENNEPFVQRRKSKTYIEENY